MCFHSCRASAKRTDATILRRPNGTLDGGLARQRHPTLKRGANNRCAYGAGEAGLTGELAAEGCGDGFAAGLAGASGGGKAGLT